MWALLHSAFVQSEIAHAVLVPAAVAVFVGACGRLLASVTPRFGRHVMSYAVPAAFLAGYFGTYSNFTVPPATVLSWVPWFLLVLTAIQSLPDGARRGAPVQLTRLLASAGAAALLLWPILRHEAPSGALATAAGVAILWAFSWAAADSPGVARVPLAAVLLSLSAALAAAAPLSGSILLGQLGAALAAALGGALLIARLTRAAAVLDGVPAATFIAGLLLVDLRFYAGAREAVMSWLLVSGAAGLAASAVVRRYETTGVRAVVLPVLAALIPAAFAITVAFKLSQAGGGY